jgi:hypothetical protein
MHAQPSITAIVGEGQSPHEAVAQAQQRMNSELATLTATRHITQIQISTTTHVSTLASHYDEPWAYHTITLVIWHERYEPH